jgi:hypothetical protein
MSPRRCFPIGGLAAPIGGSRSKKFGPASADEVADREGAATPHWEDSPVPDFEDMRPPASSATDTAEPFESATPDVSRQRPRLRRRPARGMNAFAGHARTRR